MKKFFKAALAVVAVVILACAFAGCSDKSGSIKKAFENEGYTVTAVKAEDSKELQSMLADEQKENINDYEVFSCTKGISSGVVIKFPSKDDIIKAVGQSSYDQAVESGFVNGNCFLISLSPSVVTIFKNA